MNKPAFLAIKSHSPTKPVLIFVASRRQTRITAQDLIHLCGMEENPRRFLRMSDEELEQILPMVQDETLKLSLQFGIALHHAGLVDSDRKISHELFANNKVQILVATSTLAWGVNLPAYLVIIKGTQFFDAKIDNYRDMDLTDVLQMMGRAGRPAYDTSGVAIVYTKESTKSFYKYFLNSGFPVESSLHKVLADHLGAEVSSGSVKTKQDALDFLTWTFLFRRIHKNPTYYGIEDHSEEGVNKWIVDLVDKTMDDLAESGCLNIMSGGNVSATPFLQISSYYYLSHKTIRMFLQRMKPDSGLMEILSCLCRSTEYDELPIRHNEDLINAELSEQVRYKAEDGIGDIRIIDPHVKAFLLVQTFIERLEFPIADYVQDTVSVLDQALRILQAMIDTVAEMGYLKTVLHIITLMQCIKQASWEYHDPVTLLPGMKRKERRAQGGVKLDELGRGRRAESMVSKLNVDRSQIAEFKKVAHSLPVLDIQVLRDEDDTDCLKITMVHVNSRVPKTSYTPLFHKPQRESWFVIIGSSDDRVLRLKRVTPSSKGEMDIELNAPGASKVFIVNDSMDLIYEYSI
jgi:antiviral helicase SLH1